MRDEFERLYYRCKPSQVLKEKQFLEKYRPAPEKGGDKNECRNDRG